MVSQYTIVLRVRPEVRLHIIRVAWMARLAFISTVQTLGPSLGGKLRLRAVRDSGVVGDGERVCGLPVACIVAVRALVSQPICKGCQGRREGEAAQSVLLTFSVVPVSTLTCS